MREDALTSGIVAVIPLPMREPETKQLGTSGLLPVRLYRPMVREEAIAAAADVMRSGWIGMGPRTAEFEAAFASHLGVAHAVAVNTCTSALHLAVKLLNLPPGAEVITTPITFVASNEILLWEGLTPVFADVDRRTGNLTPESVAAKLSPRTRAVLLVHLAGYPCDLDGFAALAQQHGLAVIEDCAHAAGAVYRGRRVGASGNLCAFSFGPTKNLTCGDGGMLVPRSAADDQRARGLRSLGLSRDTYHRFVPGHKEKPWEYAVAEVGRRYHMNDIHAAVGLAQLPELEQGNTRRRAHAALYRRLLADVPGLTLFDYAPDCICSYNFFAVLADRRPALVEKLTAQGVTVTVNYPRTDTYAIFSRTELPAAEYFSTHTLTLPLYPELPEAEIAYVCQIIRGGW